MDDKERGAFFERCQLSVDSWTFSVMFQLEKRRAKKKKKEVAVDEDDDDASVAVLPA